MPLPAATDFPVTGDFNGDGRTDLVASSYGASALYVLLGDAAGGLGQPQTVPLPQRPDHVAAADFNRDGKLDLLVTNYDDNSVRVLNGNGQGGLSAPVRYDAGVGSRAAVVGDFNGDGVPDVAMAKTFDRNVTILLGRADGSLAAPVNIPLEFTPSDLTVGDFNGDGRADLAGVDYFRDRAFALLGNGVGGFTFTAAIATPAGPAAVAAGDFNRDGRLDLVTADYLAGTISVFNGNGNGTFTAPRQIATASGPSDVLVADLNNSGFADISTAASNENRLLVLRGAGDGTFAAPLRFETGGLPRAAAAADFDREGQLDLATTNQNASQLTLVYRPLGTGIPSPSVPDLLAADDTGVSDTDNITLVNATRFSGTAPAGARVDLFANNTQVGSVVATTGNWQIQSSPLTEGVHTITAVAVTGTGASTPSAALQLTVDRTAPTVSGPIFVWQTAPHELTYAFSEDVGPTVAASDFQITNLTTTTPVPATLQYVDGSDTARLTFPQLANGVLPDGEYRVTLPAGTITDIAGNPLASTSTGEFVFLRGDANDDGVVNLLDFNALAANFGQSGASFSQGDFNYDGLVNLLDFNILAANFGTAFSADAVIDALPDDAESMLLKLIDETGTPSGDAGDGV